MLKKGAYFSGSIDNAKAGILPLKLFSGMTPDALPPGFNTTSPVTLTVYIGTLGGNYHPRYRWFSLSTPITVTVVKSIPRTWIFIGCIGNTQIVYLQASNKDRIKYACELFWQQKKRHISLQTDGIYLVEGIEKVLRMKQRSLQIRTIVRRCKSRHWNELRM